MTAVQIVEKYISFFEKRGHKRIANSPLVPQNDPSTLFTSSGMQPLVPYLLGEEHPSGKRLVNVQNCFRAQDIDEIGDNRHTTFFRMLGNWSLGDYFKKEQLPWFFEFLTKELKLDPKKLYVTVFEGNDIVKKDTESFEIWKSLGIKDDHIFFYGVEKNWWSRAGVPDNMPSGEPGGPDSEVFYEFTEVQHDKKYGENCHPNCNCGRFMEIGNSVFMQYKKNGDRSFEELPNKNVDFGGGLERLAAAINNNPDVFMTDVYKPIVEFIEQTSNKKYVNTDYRAYMRIIADHLTAAVFLIKDGVIPNNKDRGYILRKLIRNAIDAGQKLGIMHNFTGNLSYQVIKIHEELSDISGANVYDVLDAEENKFKNTLESSIPLAESIIDKFLSKFDSAAGWLPYRKEAAQIAFDLYQSQGLPPDYFVDLFNAKLMAKFTGFIYGPEDLEVIKVEFDKLREEHQNISKKGFEQKFRGGLADHSEKTIMGHTATHLLHQALRDVLGNHVFQTGSNITSERIRFDFNFERKLTDEEIKKVEEIVNNKIRENLPVHFEMIPTEKAKEMGAIGLFMDTYGEKSKIYFIGDYSKEFCGGPHVDFTGVLKRFKILKQENLGKGQKRIYSKVES